MTDTFLGVVGIDLGVDSRVENKLDNSIPNSVFFVTHFYLKTYFFPFTRLSIINSEATSTNIIHGFLVPLSI